MLGSGWHRGSGCSFSTTWKQNLNGGSFPTSLCHCDNRRGFPISPAPQRPYSVGDNGPRDCSPGTCRGPLSQYRAERSRAPSQPRLYQDFLILFLNILFIFLTAREKRQRGRERGSEADSTLDVEPHARLDPRTASSRPRPPWWPYKKIVKK